MNQSKENNQVENGINQTVAKKPYQAPELTEYGSISEIIKAQAGAGADGGLIAIDCTRS
jgi:hypothetical protein